MNLLYILRPSPYIFRLNDADLDVADTYDASPIAQSRSSIDLQRPLLTGGYHAGRNGKRARLRFSWG